MYENLLFKRNDIRLKLWKQFFETANFALQQSNKCTRKVDKRWSFTNRMWDDVCHPLPTIRFVPMRWNRPEIRKTKKSFFLFFQMRLTARPIRARFMIQGNKTMNQKILSSNQYVKRIGLWQKLNSFRARRLRSTYKKKKKPRKCRLWKSFIQLRRL